MNKLILLAGYPGAGKSYVCNLILNKNIGYILLSQDNIKEKLFDEYGFNNQEEKDILIERSRNEWYQKIEEEMKKDSKIILDYPFSYKQFDILTNLSKKYDYEVLTIRLVGDMEVLFERRVKRDMRPDRHLGHMSTIYHKGDYLEDHSKANDFITKEGFYDICKSRAYGNFCIGDLIELDVTDFSKVDYNSMIEQVVEFDKR